MERTKIGFAIVALVLGIIGLVFSFIPIVNNLAFFIGIIAIVFGVLALITKNKKGLSIAGIVTGVLAIAITLVLQASWSKALDDVSDELDENVANMTGENTEELLGTAVNVELGTFTVSSDEYGLVTSSLPVTVTNLKDEKASFNITIEATNPDGSRIETGYVYVDDLGAGQSYSDEAFTYISSDDVETYQNATFKVIEVSMY